MNYFEKHSNYDPRSGFSEIKFGFDRPLLDVEQNEMQEIQEEARKDIIRKSVYSGFTELVSSEFTGDSMILNPSSNGLILKNRLAIAPFKCIVNGITLNCQGNFSYNNIPNYILIDLGVSQTKSTLDELVYLEVWQEFVTGDSEIKAYGYANGNSLGTLAMDSRVNEETSRRVVTYWNIQTKQECDFDTYPEGFGYSDMLHYSAVFPKCNGQFTTSPNVNLCYCSAENDLFIDEPFYGDKNLYVAGRPNYDIQSSTLKGRYVFAIPMFRVRRRNTTKYSFNNYNGAPSYNAMLVSNDSSLKGDLKNNMRPDMKAYDSISKSDIIDLRKTITFSSIRYNAIADDTIRDIFNNNLETSQTKKMRRVQIGNKPFDYTNVSSTIFHIPFNGSIIQEYPTNDPLAPRIYEKSIYYESSLNHLGAVIDNNTELSYTINDLVEKDRGTIDFFIKPNWNGCDETSQIILSIVNESNSPIIQLRKEKNLLIFAQYNYEVSNDNYIENKAIANLSETLMISGRYYHVRLSYNENPSPVIGQIYVYLNGSLIAQSNCSVSYLTPYRFKIGDLRNTTNPGFVIEEVLMYNRCFEVVMGSGTGYSYMVNNFWPMLPHDFLESDTLLAPSFDSIINNLSDNEFEQEDTVFYREYDKDVSLKTFTISLNSDRYISEINAIYDMSGNNLTDSIYGKCEGLGTNIVQFKPYDQSLEKVVIHCKVCFPAGCGGLDMPTEILAAGIVKYDLDMPDSNYDYPLDIIEEVSFHKKDSEYPRKVPYLKPRKVFGNEDEAYDFANSTRTKSQCYARLIYYNISGNGTNQYDIPMEMYGYKIISIVGTHTNRITSITKTPSTIIGEEDLNYTIKLEYPLNIGDTLTLELGCSGYSFDYDLNSKTIFTNMHKCKLLEFTANGVDNVYTLPCMDIIHDGEIRGGILKSVYTFNNNILDENGNITGQYDTEILGYHDGEIFYDEYGQATNKRIWNTIPVHITEDSFGTPFITIIFDESSKPRNGVSIQIPIMISYQMSSDELLSIWYNHIPYQGVMTTKTKEVTRVTPWTYFITTLSTGKPNNENIILNLVNELPGGMYNGYQIDNQDIILKDIFNDMSYALNNENVNKKLVFMNDFMLKGINEGYCNLVNTYKISKDSSYFQDGKITFANIDFNLYFNDCVNPIKKYVCGYCLVINERGEVMLLVVSNINYNTTVINHLNPVYGDLFYVKGRLIEK